MIFATLASCVLLGQGPRMLTAQVEGASMFKNGFAVMTRSMDVPTSGEYFLESIPQASLGTLWFGTTNGVKIREIVNTNQDKASTVSANSIDDLLTMNVGQTVRLGMRDGDAVTKQEVSGKIVSATGVIVLLDTGKEVIAIPKTTITSLAANGGSLKTSNTVKYGNRVLRFVVDAPQGGKITMVSLERGLSWTPGYMVDITDPKKLRMVAKATITNDLAELDGIVAKFVTGFPNLPYAFALDPLTQAPNYAAFAAAGRSGGFGGGGMGGGMAGQMAQNAAAPLEARDIATAMDTSPLVGDEFGDLFFYKQPNVKLKIGDRAYYVLFQAEADYTHLYTWDVADSMANDAEYRGIEPNSPQEFWHSVRFKNNASQPLTTGAATTTKSGEILGQDQIKYTPAGAETELRITKALDIRAEADEEEVSRERQNLRLWNGVTFDLVTLKGTLSVLNQKREQVDIKVTKEITGDLVSTELNPATTKLAKRLSAVNSRNRLVWSLPLQPGQNVKLTYTYKVYVRD